MYFWTLGLIEELTIMPEILVPPLLIFAGWLFYRNYQLWNRNTRLRRQIARNGYERAIHEAIFTDDALAFFVLDGENMTIIEASASCEKLFHGERSQLVGMSPDSLIPEGERIIGAVKQRLPRLSLPWQKEGGHDRTLDLRLSYRTWLDRPLALVAALPGQGAGMGCPGESEAGERKNVLRAEGEEKGGALSCFATAELRTKWEKEGFSRAKFTSLNLPMQRLLSKSLREGAGLSVDRVFPHLAECWQLAKFEMGGRQSIAPFDYRTGEGRYFRCSIHQDEADPCRYFLEMVDFSDREKKTLSLRRKANRYYRVFDQAGVGILVLDRKMKIQESNRGFAHLLKQPYPGHENGETLLERIAPEDREEIGRQVASLFEGDRSLVAFEARFRTREGERLWCHVCLSVIRGKHGEVVSLVAIVFDITESKTTHRQLLEAREEAVHLAKKAEAASQAKSEFMANMSHEIRTPMNGVLGMVEILGDSELNPDQQRYLATIRNSSHSLMIILNDILDFSKIEAGELVMNEEPFDLEASVYDVATLMAHNAYRKGVELAISYPTNFPKLFLGDGARIRQILYNLIGNAVKFTQSGHVAVTVDGSLGGDPNDPHAEMRLSVSDTGIGISKQDQKNIFDRFQQADVTIGTKFGGTGLGLAISRKLVELMGGSLELESEPDQGTTFTIRLSLKSFLFKPALLSSDSRQTPCRHVLVVSNQTVFRRVIDRSLDAWGIQREHLPPDISAINRLIDAGADRSIDLVLLDVEADYLHEGDRLVEHVGRFSRLGIPVIVFLPLDRLEYQNRLQVPGVLDIVLKPFTESNLRTAMGDFLGSPGSAEPLQREASPGHRPLYHVRAMIVEDQETNAVVARKMLEGFGCQVEVFGSGEEAIRKLSSSELPYDLIFMDCRMPGMDGYETTKRIRYLERTGVVSATPIIATTAYALGGDRTRCIEAGMDDYLAKPLQYKDIGNVLRKYCKGKEIDFSATEKKSWRPASRQGQFDFRFDAPPGQRRSMEGPASHIHGGSGADRPHSVSSDISGPVPSE